MYAGNYSRRDYHTVWYWPQCPFSKRITVFRISVSLHVFSRSLQFQLVLNPSSGPDTVQRWADLQYFGESWRHRVETRFGTFKAACGDSARYTPVHSTHYIITKLMVGWNTVSDTFSASVVRLNVWNNLMCLYDAAELWSEIIPYNGRASEFVLLMIQAEQTSENVFLFLSTTRGRKVSRLLIRHFTFN